MKNKEQKLSLQSVDDLLISDEIREENNKDKITEIEIDKLYPFNNHPFKVLDDELMEETKESIMQLGIHSPLLVRHRDEGGYEIISGHRRHRACELLGLETVPVIVRDMTDDEATIVMVDSNIYRESILPSERAFSYKMKLEAMTSQGKRNDLTCSQVGNKTKGIKSAEILAEQMQTSKNQIYRFVRLTELNDVLLDMVDDKQIGLNPAVELSYLQLEEQNILIDVMDREQCTPSLSQAKRLKKFSLEGMCTFESMSVILSEEKKTEIDKISISTDSVAKYFPKSYTPKKMEAKIMQLLENWSKSQKIQQDR